MPFLLVTTHSHSNGTQREREINVCALVGLDTAWIDTQKTPFSCALTNVCLNKWEINDKEIERESVRERQQKMTTTKKWKRDPNACRRQRHKFALDFKHLFMEQRARGLIDKVNTIYANYTWWKIDTITDSEHQIRCEMSDSTWNPLFQPTSVRLWVETIWMFAKWLFTPSINWRISSSSSSSSSTNNIAYI